MSGTLYAVEPQDSPYGLALDVDLCRHVALQLSDASVGPVEPSRQPLTG
jgi:hypothetical protein